MVDEYGDLAASPFSVQFGKKDIWLPRSGHVVKIKVNSEEVPVGMVLDSEGRAYFPTQHNHVGKRQYRFWSALLGLGDGNPKHRTTTATSSQLSRLGLQPGVNSILFQVKTASGNLVTTQSNLHLINNTSRLVVSDIDGTVTKSNNQGEKFSQLLFKIFSDPISVAFCCQCWACQTGNMRGWWSCTAR